MRQLSKFLLLFTLLGSFGMSYAQGPDPCSDCANQLILNTEANTTLFREALINITPFVGSESSTFWAGKDNSWLNFWDLMGVVDNLIGMASSSPSMAAVSALDMSFELVSASSNYWSDMNNLTGMYNNAQRQLDDEFCYCLNNFNCSNGC